MAYERARDATRGYSFGPPEVRKTRAGQFRGLGATTGSNGIDGSGLTLTLATANITGGTGRLIVNVYYRLWGIVTP